MYIYIQSIVTVPLLQLLPLPSPTSHLSRVQSFLLSLCYADVFFIYLPIDLSISICIYLSHVTTHCRANYIVATERQGAAHQSIIDIFEQCFAAASFGQASDNSVPLPPLASTSFVFLGLTRERTDGGVSLLHCL